MSLHGQGDAHDEETSHDRVVVRATDQGEQHERFIALSTNARRVTTHAAREQHDPVTNHRHGRHLEQSQSDDGRELVVSRDLVDRAVKEQEEWSVGAGVLPQSGSTGAT